MYPPELRLLKIQKSWGIEEQRAIFLNSLALSLLDCILFGTIQEGFGQVKYSVSSFLSAYSNIYVNFRDPRILKQNVNKQTPIIYILTLC